MSASIGFLYVISFHVLIFFTQQRIFEVLAFADNSPHRLCCSRRHMWRSCFFGGGFWRPPFGVSSFLFINALSFFPFIFGRLQIKLSFRWQLDTTSHLKLTVLKYVNNALQLSAKSQLRVSCA